MYSYSLCLAPGGNDIVKIVRVTWLVSRNGGVCSGEGFLCSWIQQKGIRKCFVKIFSITIQKKRSNWKIYINIIKNFKTTDCLCQCKSPRRLIVQQEAITGVCNTIHRSLGRLAMRVNCEMQISQPIIWKILRKKLKMIPNKVQVFSKI